MRQLIAPGTRVRTVFDDLVVKEINWAFPVYATYYSSLSFAFLSLSNTTSSRQLYQNVWANIISSSPEWLRIKDAYQFMRIRGFKLVIRPANLFANTNLSSMPTLFANCYVGNYAITDNNIIASADGSVSAGTTQCSPVFNYNIPQSIVGTNGYIVAGSDTWINIADFNSSNQLLYLAIGYTTIPTFESTASTYQTITHNIEISLIVDVAGSVPKF